MNFCSKFFVLRESLFSWGQHTNNLTRIWNATSQSLIFFISFRSSLQSIADHIFDGFLYNKSISSEEQKKNQNPWLWFLDLVFRSHPKSIRQKKVLTLNFSVVGNWQKKVNLWMTKFTLWWMTNKNKKKQKGTCGGFTPIIHVWHSSECSILALFSSKSCSLYPVVLYRAVTN